MSDSCVAPRSGIRADSITLRCITSLFKMLIRQNVWRTALFHRPALVELHNFYKNRCEIMPIMAGLSTFD